MNGIQDMTSLKQMFLKRFNSLGQTQREEHTYWHNMKFDHTQHDFKQCNYGLNILGKMASMSDNQLLEYISKDHFLQR